MAIDKNGRIDPKSAAKYAENWMKMLPGMDSNLFVAYDKNNGGTKRAISFTLNEKGLKHIQGILKKGTDIEHFMVKLGANHKTVDDLNKIPNQPYFYPMLGVTINGDTTYYALEWDATPPFLYERKDQYKSYSVKSGVDAISPRNAYLFIKDWMDRPFDKLGRAFVGTANGFLQRVRHYRYITVESGEMAKAIQTASEVYMHIGAGGVNPEHPFAFRPIIETVEKGDGALKADAGGSSFEFSSPCPPICYP